MLEFLDHVMGNMGFGVRQRNWIRECIFIANISILVNGLPFRQFGMKRELLQSCPLYLFLFNNASEALSSILRKVKSIGLCKRGEDWR